MSRVAHQAQQAAQLPRDAANQRHHEIIDLISDEEDEGGVELDSELDLDDYPSDSLADSLDEDAAFDDRGLFVDAPPSPVRAQDPPPRHVPRAEFDIIDLMGPDLQRAVPPAPAQAPARPANPPPARNEVWGDYIIDDVFDGADFARAVQNDDDWRIFAPAEPPILPLPRAVPAPAAGVQHPPEPLGPPEPQDECIQAVAAVFPGICLDHVADLYNKISKFSVRLIAHILDQMDKGIVYPKAKDKAKDLKRKRVVDEIEEAARKYGAPDRVISAHAAGIRPYM